MTVYCLMGGSSTLYQSISNSSLPYNIALFHFAFPYAIITQYITAFISLNRYLLAQLGIRKYRVLRWLHIVLFCSFLCWSKFLTCVIFLQRNYFNINARQIYWWQIFSVFVLGGILFFLHIWKIVSLDTEF